MRNNFSPLSTAFTNKCLQQQLRDVGHLRGNGDRDEPRPGGSGLGWGPHGAYGQAKAGLHHENSTNPKDSVRLSDHSLGNEMVLASAGHLLPFCSAELLGNNLTIIKK